MPTIAPKLRFDKSGYYFIGLIVLTILGFWRSYFSRFINGTNDYSFYFHFHAFMMTTWMALLIAQPILIRKKKLHIHRILGKVSYVVMPVMLLSVILVLNKGLQRVPEKDITFNGQISPIRDLILLIVAFTIGVIYRRDINIHARAMVVSGLLFVEPTLARFLGGMIFHGAMAGYLLTMVLICAMFIALIVIERKQKRGRWIFPAVFVVFLLAYAIIIFDLQFPVLDVAVRWFAKQPLT